MNSQSGDPIMREAIIHAGERNEGKITEISRKLKEKFDEGKVPIGYNYINGNLEVDAFEVSLIRYLYNWWNNSTKEERSACESESTLVLNMIRNIGEWKIIQSEPVISPEIFAKAQEKLIKKHN